MLKKNRKQMNTKREDKKNKRAKKIENGENKF